MLDVNQLRYTRMSTVLHVLCQLWARCVRTVQCVFHPSRRSPTMRHFCGLVEGIEASLSRTGRLKDPERLKCVLIRAMFEDWDPVACPPPKDMGCSVEGRTTVMVMVLDAVCRVWAAMPKHSREPVMVEFGDYVAGVRRCFREDGRVLERPAELDTLLARHYSLAAAAVAAR
jgi:hypothetical protein